MISQNVLIVGSGNLGSRHLQGVLRSENSSNVYVFDKSFSSLSLAKERALEFVHNKKIYYSNSLSDFPSQFHLAIVATNADVRAKIVEDLLSMFNIQYMVLEKILFQKKDDYKKIDDLLRGSKTIVYVNHPRRMFEQYKIVKESFNKSIESNIFMTVFGGNWGLACNGLHFIDLFIYLFNCSLESIDTSKLDPDFINSKREGNIELTGELIVNFSNNNKLSIISNKGEFGPLSINIMSLDNRWLIHEANEYCLINMKKSNSFQPKTSKINLKYQSSLTAEITNDIFEQGRCKLTEYSLASCMHKEFISRVLDFYNLINKTNLSVCPIT